MLFMIMKAFFLYDTCSFFQGLIAFCAEEMGGGGGRGLAAAECHTMEGMTKNVLPKHV